MSARSRRLEYDIKAPDGYSLGGVRRVRKDGTILFGRGWWKAPDKWAGQRVWVHEAWQEVPGKGDSLFLEAAHPGLHIYEARSAHPVPLTVFCHRTERPDAKPTFRLAAHKAWAAREQSK